MLYSHIILSLIISVSVTVALDLNIDDKDSVCAAAAAIVQGEWNYYDAFNYGGVIGKFTTPYYWWQAGLCFGGMLHYFQVCDPKNTTLEKLIYDGMYIQAGSDFNYMPSNETFVEGNDDQGVWGLTTMEAVERNFTNSEDHSWLELTQAIYNTMNARWDDTNCGGGLRWQIFTWNSGYDYKNSIANGCLFHISARLARYTKNDTYVETADRIWNWMIDVGFIVYEDIEGGEFIIYDGGNIPTCSEKVTKLRWSYNYGIFMAGCAYLYNHTQNDTWAERAEEILTAGSYFFNGKYMTETTCQHAGTCNNDQRSFRAIWARCLSLTSILVPHLYDEIRTYIEDNAAAAALSCSGGSDGVTCGLDWSAGKWDGKYGLGEQMSALEVIMAVLSKVETAPYTSTNGGSSRGNPEAGTNTNTDTNKKLVTITGKDRAGAGVLTAIVLLIILGGGVWMIF